MIEKGVLTVTTVTLAPFSASPAGVTAPSGYLATMTETTSTNCTYTSDCVQTFQIQIKNLNDNCTMSGNFISNFDRFNGTIGAIDVIDAYSLSMIVQFFYICTNNIATSQSVFIQGQSVQLSITITSEVTPFTFDIIDLYAEDLTDNQFHYI